MIPDSAGRPFLDHVPASLAGGVATVALVVAPDHAAIADHSAIIPRPGCRSATPCRPRRRGLPMRCWPPIGTRRRTVTRTQCRQSHPITAIAALAALEGPGLASSSLADALLANSNVPAERVGAFALVTLDREGMLRELVKKPDAAQFATAADDAAVSMMSGASITTSWRPSRRAASSRGDTNCRRPSAGGARGMRLRAVESRAGCSTSPRVATWPRLPSAGSAHGHAMSEPESLASARRAWPPASATGPGRGNGRVPGRSRCSASTRLCRGRSLLAAVERGFHIVARPRRDAGASGGARSAPGLAGADRRGPRTAPVAGWAIRSACCDGWPATARCTHRNDAALCSSLPGPRGCHRRAHWSSPPSCR